MRPTGLRCCLIALAVCALPLTLPSSARAQASDQPSPTTRQPAPDFLLKRPKGSVGVRGAWVFARAGSDLFDFLHEQLTIEKGDFRTPAVGVDVALAVTPRIEAAFGIEFGRASMKSEYRDLVDNDFLPIEQTTALSTLHLIGELRYAFVPRGHAVSRLAWVPRRVVPYVGAGGGAVSYEFSQTGDFVDFVDQSVFSDSFRSEGWAPTVHVFGGLDLLLHRRLLATVEARSAWADAPLGSSFEDFDPIDLTGFRMSGGIKLIF